MSESKVKAERKEEKEKAEAEAQEVLFQIVIDVHKNGGFSMLVPKGASVILAQDVLMRAQTQVWGTLLENMAKMGKGQRLVQPMSGIPEGLIRRPQG